MSNPLYDNIKRDPRYAQLVRERARFATTLALLVIGVFFAFVLLVAFVPGVIAQRLSEGSNLTVGIALGFAQFVFFCALTWVYVRRANRDFDPRNAQIVQDALRKS
ncbi:MAG: hypothetical protein ABT02_18880 [Comamonadaceae bacterium SCN 68-20]|jgi:cation/acetate symporter|nr:DUF485 domain-containing protein [Comamonadaceae bacterium]ODU56976.1 MAG: hypothetical protein ABT02_18880 [Comamonadaceae bacterium SCN 68-20]OJX10502.1 MAG: hypothetical protein BGO75_19230 [Burkholderiales bacterium 68-20]UJB66363.1 DUF485 domain-containing protein [Acidovorax sp. YS12]